MKKLLTLLSLLVASVAFAGIMEDPIPTGIDYSPRAFAKPFAVGMLTLAGQIPAPSPSQEVSNILSQANIPQAVSLTNVSLDLAAGVIASMGADSKVENILEGRWHFTQTFFLGGEIQNGPASSIVDVAGLFIGVRKAWDTAELYGMAGGRRNFSSVDASGATHAAWEVVAGGGASWRPITSGVLQSAALYSEPVLVYRIGSSKNAAVEVRAGVRWFF